MSMMKRLNDDFQKAKDDREPIATSVLPLIINEAEKSGDSNGHILKIINHHVKLFKTTAEVQAKAGKDTIAVHQRIAFLEGYLHLGDR